MTMGISSTCLPENIRRCMRPEDRIEMKMPTTAEGVAVEDAKGERALQRQILGYLATREIEVCCPSAVKRSTIKLGWPDMTFAYRGLPVVWEIKTPIGTLRPEQKAIIPKLIANGWRHEVVRSVEQAKEILYDLDDQHRKLKELKENLQQEINELVQARRKQ